MPVATPLPAPIEAIFGNEDVQVAAVRGCVLPSLSVTVPLYCSACPIATAALTGAMRIRSGIGAVTCRPVLPVIPLTEA